VKDAGDDPDVTHGALIRATVRHGAPGSGVTFRAGDTMMFAVQEANGDERVFPDPSRFHITRERIRTCH
jgi:cobalamin biosynthesis protein CbiD